MHSFRDLQIRVGAGTTVGLQTFLVYQSVNALGVNAILIAGWDWAYQARFREYSMYCTLLMFTGYV